MLGRELLIALAHRKGLGGLYETPRTFCIFLDVHESLPGRQAFPEASRPRQKLIVQAPSRQPVGVDVRSLRRAEKFPLREFLHRRRASPENRTV
jgi:hypothetical protein